MKLKAPLHFAPHLKSVIWGGDKIASFKKIKTDVSNIGESWEVSAIPGFVSVVDRGELKGQSLTDLTDRYGADLLGSDVVARFGNEFPLMIKFIDSSGDLSVQVHPGHELALSRHGCKGKTEMWHIIHASEGAKIYLGFKRDITPGEFNSLVAENRIMEVINSYDSAPGDTFFIPPGRIHAIGAGNLLVEIQESSDITYRIYDYDRRDAQGNPRELHSELAAEAIDYNGCPKHDGTHFSPDGNPTRPLVNCSCFNVVRHDITDPVELHNDRRSMMILMGIEGSSVISYPDGETVLPAGDTLLLPASLGPASASGPATIISVTIGPDK